MAFWVGWGGWVHGWMMHPCTNACTRQRPRERHLALSPLHSTYPKEEACGAAVQTHDVLAREGQHEAQGEDDATQDLAVGLESVHHLGGEDALRRGGGRGQEKEEEVGEEGREESPRCLGLHAWGRALWCCVVLCTLCG